MIARSCRSRTATALVGFIGPLGLSDRSRAARVSA